MSEEGLPKGSICVFRFQFYSLNPADVTTSLFSAVQLVEGYNSTLAPLAQLILESADHLRYPIAPCSKSISRIVPVWVE